MFLLLFLWRTGKTGQESYVGVVLAQATGWCWRATSCCAVGSTTRCSFRTCEVSWSVEHGHAKVYSNRRCYRVFSLSIKPASRLTVKRRRSKRAKLCKSLRLCRFCCFRFVRWHTEWHMDGWYVPRSINGRYTFIRKRLVWLIFFNSRRGKDRGEGHFFQFFGESIAFTRFFRSHVPHDRCAWRALLVYCMLLRISLCLSWFRLLGPGNKMGGVNDMFSFEGRHGATSKSWNTSRSSHADVSFLVSYPPHAPRSHFFPLRSVCGRWMLPPEIVMEQQI